MTHDSFTTISEILKYRAMQQPEQSAVVFINSNQEETLVSYAQLDTRAKALASEIQRALQPQERVLLLYHPSVEYIVAFFACLYAGVIPVPVYPPDSKNLQRLLVIMKDCKATVALSTAKVISYVNKLSSNTLSNQVRKDSIDFLSKINWISTDTIDNAASSAYKNYEAKPEDVVFLQYTSGSTGHPKGVILDNNNLIDNLKVTKQSFNIYDTNTKVISWLPPYHDMGLIGGILQPVYSGIELIAMAPMTFLKRPYVWLSEITKRGKEGPVITGAPNFAYDLCLGKITEEQFAQLDLSNWTVAFTGAEPVRYETLVKFSEKYKAVGFEFENFSPVYGLAEGTLLASSGDMSKAPNLLTVNKKHIKAHIVEVLEDGITENAIKVMSCGTAEEGHRIAVVNPETLEPCDDLNVGEIWLKSPSVAKGYWNKPELTETQFKAYLPDTKEGPFFRTGDMGFLYNDELYVSGRLKDMIIIRGKNYFPQDIELKVEQADESLREGCGVAISTEIDNEEQLVIIQEVKREYLKTIDVEKVQQAIRRAVFADIGIQPQNIVLIKPSTLPKTSSGKLQRSQAKTYYLEGAFQSLDTQKTIATTH